MRRCMLPLIALCCVLADQPRTQGCGCLNVGPAPTLLDRFIDAPVLVTGRFQNAVGPNNALLNGQTELVLDGILVPHDLLKGRKSVFVPRVITSKEKFLVAMELHKGQLEAIGGMEIDAKGEIVKYIGGAIQLKDKSTQGRLRYSVDFLSSQNDEVARSAHGEFILAAGTKYADFRKVAESLKPEPFVKALQNADMPAWQRGVYAMLLGHCGKKEDAVILRKLIDAPWDPKQTLPLDSMLVGYTMLDPEAGWRLLTISAEQEDKNFLQRYAVLQAMRRLGTDRKDLVNADKAAKGIALFLKVRDMADFAVEDLRKMKRWDYCDAILDLSAKEGYNSPLMRRSILRFALQCPAPRAKAHAQIQRAGNSDWVTETEELLALEKEDAAGPKK